MTTSSLNLCTALCELCASTIYSFKFQSHLHLHFFCSLKSFFCKTLKLVQRKRRSRMENTRELREIFWIIFFSFSFSCPCYCQIFENVVSAPEMLFSHPGSIIISDGWRAMGDRQQTNTYRSICAFSIIRLVWMNGRFKLRIVNHLNVCEWCSYAKCVHCLEKLEQKWSALKSPNGMLKIKEMENTSRGSFGNRIRDKHCTVFVCCYSVAQMEWWELLLFDDCV